MRPLRNFIDNIKPNFEKGGKFYFLHSVFDGFESFLFVPNKVVKSGAHIRDGIDLKRTMIVVVLALIPALLFGIFNVGVQHFLAQYLVKSEYANISWKDIISIVGFWQIFFFGFLKVLPLIIVSYTVGLGIEFAFAQVKGHSINEGFLVSGMLIPLIVPADIPLWMLAVATAFAVIFGKEVFGGTGMNIVNPALLTRAFLFFAYPAQMSGDNVWIVDKPDVVSGATPMALCASGQTADIMSPFDMLIGFMPGSVGETSVIAILLGAFILIYTGIGSFKIMLSTVVGALAIASIFNFVGANEYMNIPPYFHLIMGGFAFGAIFMATDPVTASQTPLGKIIYGFLIGAFTVVLRVLNPAYPEGMMLAILFMNIMAPLIDHYVVQAHIKNRIKYANKLKSKKI